MRPKPKTDRELLEFMGPRFNLVSIIEIAQFLFPNSPVWRRKKGPIREGGEKILRGRAKSRLRELCTTRDPRHPVRRCIQEKKKPKRVHGKLSTKRYIVTSEQWAITKYGQAELAGGIGRSNEPNADVEYDHFVQVVCDRLLEECDFGRELPIIRLWIEKTAGDRIPRMFYNQVGGIRAMPQDTLFGSTLDTTRAIAHALVGSGTLRSRSTRAGLAAAMFNDCTKLLGCRDRELADELKKLVLPHAMNRAIKCTRCDAIMGWREASRKSRDFWLQLAIEELDARMTTVHTPKTTASIAWDMTICHDCLSKKYPEGIPYIQVPME